MRDSQDVELIKVANQRLKEQVRKQSSAIEKLLLSKKASTS